MQTGKQTKVQQTNPPAATCIAHRSKVTMSPRKALLFFQGTILHQILQHSTQQMLISEKNNLKKISKISQDLPGKK